MIYALIIHFFNYFSIKCLHHNKLPRLITGEIMKYNKFSSIQILLTLFLVKFYLNHIIIAPYFYELYSKTSFIILCIIFLIQPFELIFIYKLFNKKYKVSKSNNIFIFIYSRITSTLIILSLFYFLDTYIYNIDNIYLLLLGIILPIIYLNKFIDTNIIRLTPAFFIFTLLFIIFFFFTIKDPSLYSIFPNKDINNLPILIILIINITFPYVLFPYLKDLSNSKFKLKEILIFGIIFTILNIFITIREGLTLGILITDKTFPQYEILRFLSINNYSLPLDILFIIYLYFFSFYVLSLINNHLYHSLNIKNYHLKNIITVIPFLLAIILINNFKLFEMIKYDLIVISSFCLIYIFITTLFNYVRSKKNE